MLKFLLATFLLFFSVQVFSQASDFITVVKRNGRTVKTFFPGLSISFETFDKRAFSGEITSIRHDSVFIREWDIRPVLNFVGIPTVDTLGTFMAGFHYKEIDKVEVSDRMRLQQITPGRILIIGGAGYALLNVINGAYLHQSVTSKKNLTSLGIATGAVGLGLLFNYISKHRNRYHVEYIHMNETKKPLRGF